MSAAAGRNPVLVVRHLTHLPQTIAALIVMYALKDSAAAASAAAAAAAEKEDDHKANTKTNDDGGSDSDDGGGADEKEEASGIPSPIEHSATAQAENAKVYTPVSTAFIWSFPFVGSSFANVRRIDYAVSVASRT